MIMLNMPLLFAGATMLTQHHTRYLSFYRCGSIIEKSNINDTMEQLLNVVFLCNSTLRTNRFKLLAYCRNIAQLF